MRNWTDICRGKGVFFCFVFLSTDGRMNTPSHKEPVRCLSLGSWPFQCQQTALPMQFPPKISLSREGRADQTWCLGNFVWRENTWKQKTDNQEVLRRTISRGKTLLVTSYDVLGAANGLKERLRVFHLLKSVWSSEGREGLFAWKTLIGLPDRLEYLIAYLIVSYTAVFDCLIYCSVWLPDRLQCLIAW